MEDYGMDDMEMVKLSAEAGKLIMQTAKTNLDGFGVSVLIVAHFILLLSKGDEEKKEFWLSRIEDGIRVGVAELEDIFCKALKELEKEKKSSTVH